MRTLRLLEGAALAVLALAPVSAQAGSHLWVINELFSDQSGNVQFIEMHVPSNDANERFMNGKWVLSQATGHQLNLTHDLPINSTAFAYLLLGTQAYANLPGAPTPDYIITPSFFNKVADTIRWWQYGTGDLAFTAGQLPLDGVHSMNRDHTTGTNSPTNFNGETGSVNANQSDTPGGVAAEPSFYLRAMGELTGTMHLEFQLPSLANAKLTAYDSNGRLLRVLYDARTEGTTRLDWDGADSFGRKLPSGVYLLRLEAAGRTAVRKVPILR